MSETGSTPEHIDTSKPHPARMYDYYLGGTDNYEVDQAAGDYVDNDPVLSTYAGARLTSDGNAGFVLADVRDPKVIIEHPAMRGLIDFDEPFALMLVALLHFVRDAEDPAGIVATLTERLPAGSCLILSHITHDFRTDGSTLAEVTKVYNKATATLNLRNREEVLRLFAGFELLDPGLVQSPLWRPDGPVPPPAELHQHVGYAGVGVKKA